jgi:hypothetical protein
MEFPKVPEIIFSTKLSYKERFELLKKAKDLSHVIKPYERPHGRGNMTLPNTIGSKRILDEKMNTTSTKPAVLVRDANKNIREYAGCKCGD